MLVASNAFTCRYFHLHTLVSGHTIASGDGESFIRISTTSRIVPSPFFPAGGRYLQRNEAYVEGKRNEGREDESVDRAGDFSHTIDCFARISPQWRSQNHSRCWITL